MQTCDESFENLVDDMYTETGALPFIGEVQEGPTLEGLKANLFGGDSSREPLTFTVSLPQLSEKPHQLLVLVMGMLRYGKDPTWWKLLGLYLGGELQWRRVGIHYNSETRTGKVMLDPPPWR